jgi:hypothetical protein
LLHHNTLTGAALIAKKAWKRAGGYDESMRLGYEDWDFWLRLADHDCFGVRLPRVLFHYRRREGSKLSRSGSGRTILGCIRPGDWPRSRRAGPQPHAWLRWEPATSRALMTFRSFHPRTRTSSPGPPRRMRF